MKSFSKSERIAIEFITRLIGGDLPQQDFPKPDWKNFEWFQAIGAEKIEKGKKEYESGVGMFRRLIREIVFYGYGEIRLAEVWLCGNEFLNSDKSKPNFWRVMAVSYRDRYDASRIFDCSSWTGLSIHVSEELSPLS